MDHRLRHCGKMHSDLIPAQPFKADSWSKNIYNDIN